MTIHTQRNSKEILDKIDYGVRLGAARAIAEHKKAGRSIVVWKNGKIVSGWESQLVMQARIY